jgi:ligand-binding sensor domain-containing protein
MSGRGITAYVPPRTAITHYRRVSPSTPEPVHAGWTSFVSQRSVRAIAVARRSARVWLATWGGVFSWQNDGDDVYHRYASEHGLASNASACLALDVEERPWVGHVEGGLSHFDFDGRRWWSVETLRDEPIRAICTAAGSGVWAAGGAAVYRIAAPGREPILAARDHDGSVDALALLGDDDGVLLGNAWGLYRLVIGDQPRRLEPGTLSSCTALARDGRGRLWAATADAVYRLTAGGLDGPFTPPEPATAGRILGLAAGRDTAWVWTAVGLARIREDRWEPVPWPIDESGTRRSLPIRALAAHDDNLAWLGTDDLLGLLRCQGTESDWDLDVLLAHRDDALGNLGRCTIERRALRDVLVGTAQGLVRFGPGAEPSLDRNAGDVLCLCGDYLLARPRGVGRIDRSGRVAFVAKQPPGLPLTMALDLEGALHILTTQGLSRLRIDDYQEIGTPGVDDQARCLVQTLDRTWWLGTTRGLFRLAERGWELAGEQPGPTLAEVHGLAVAGENLWAATEEGLWMRQDGGWIRHAPYPSNPAAPVRAIAAAGDPGVLWLAGLEGVIRYDPAAGASDAAYTPANSGLAGRRVTALLESAGTLWVVTQSGISRLALDSWRPSHG